MDLGLHIVVSLDGVMQGPGGADEDMGRLVEARFAQADALLGASTQDWRAWPAAP